LDAQLWVAPTLHWTPARHDLVFSTPWRKDFSSPSLFGKPNLIAALTK
jgi:hypothetical protein